VPGGLEKRLLDNSLILIIFFYDNFMIGTHGGEDGADISADRLYFGADASPNLCFDGLVKSQTEHFRSWFDTSPRTENQVLGVASRRSP
jgi:hypothetical protein